MARTRLMDYLMRKDGRNPYGSRGGYVDSRMGGDYEYRRVSDYQRDSRDYNQQNSQYQDERNRRDYQSNGQYDMARNNYNDMRMDGHYPMVQGYRPVEAMGRFTGYYGMGEDYANYDRRDYADSADYGESLTRDELEQWKHKLLKEVDDKDRGYFEIGNIEQKAKQLNVDMKEVKPEELVVASLMMYTDYCKELKPYVGTNMDVYIRLGNAFLNDKDSSVKGGEKLALYKDIVSG